MHAKSLSSIDLNLLLALDALLDTQSVTAAAKRVHLSQPAMSRALARLRDQLDDPLMVRQGSNMVPTPFAIQLRPRLRDALHRLERLLKEREAFSPATSTAVFRIACMDFAQLVFLPGGRTRMAAEAPGVEVVVQPYREPYEPLLESGDVDLVVGARLPAHDWVAHASLFENHHLCLAAQGNPWLQEPTLERFLASPQLMVSMGGQERGFVDEVLAAQGHSRKVCMRVPDFLGAVVLAAQTDLLLVVPQLVGLRAGELLPVDTRPVPIALPATPIFMMWHKSRSDHAPLSWFRTTIQDAVQSEVERLVGLGKG